MSQNGKNGSPFDERAAKVSHNEVENSPSSAVNKPLPAPALLVIEPLARLNHERVRAELRDNKSWLFNYSIVKIDAPDLARILNDWLQALEETIFPLRVGSIELTFGRPLAKDTPNTDGAEAFAKFARTCSKLIERVAPDEPTNVHLSWSHNMLSMSDSMNDWRLDLDPIRTEVDAAVDQLFVQLNGWLRGMDSLRIGLVHPRVDAS